MNANMSCGFIETSRVTEMEMRRHLGCESEFVRQFINDMFH